MSAAYSNQATTATVSGTTYSVTLPTYSAGDLVIIHHSVYNTQVANRPIPDSSGWTVVGPILDISNRSFLLWRIMDGGEGETVSVSVSGVPSGTTYNRAHAVTITGAGSITIEAVTAGAAGVTSAAASVGPITTTGVDMLVLAFFHDVKGLGGADAFSATTGGVTERYDDLGGVGSHNQALEELAAADPDDYTIAGNYSGTANRTWEAYLVAVPSSTSGSQTAVIGTEHVLYNTGMATRRMRLTVDTSVMLAGDELELRVYKMGLSGGTRRVAYFARYTGAQPASEAMKVSRKISTALSDSGALRFTLKQVAGTGRSFPWVVDHA